MFSAILRPLSLFSRRASMNFIQKLLRLASALLFLVFLPFQALNGRSLSVLVEVFRLLKAFTQTLTTLLPTLQRPRSASLGDEKPSQPDNCSLYNLFMALFRWIVPSQRNLVSILENERFRHSAVSISVRSSFLSKMLLLTLLRRIKH